MAAPPPPSGLLSNVFSLLSREIESFVATAAGADPPKRPRASTSRVRLNGVQRNDASKGAKAAAAGDAKNSEGEGRVRDETRAGPSRQLRRGVDAAGNGDEDDARPAPAAPTLSDSATRRIADTVASQSQSQSQQQPDRPVSLPNLASKKPHATMPGSLFPRSASMEPDPTPAPARTDDTRPLVRYVPAMRSPLFQIIKEEEDEPARTAALIVVQSPGSSANPFFVQDEDLDRPLPARRVISSTENAIRFLNELHPSPRSSPSPMAPPTPEASASTHHPVEEEDVQPARRSQSKGKERAHDSSYEFLYAETSQEIRIRGKEDELERAREEHFRKEQELDPDASLALEERERDKERIKFLEGEVARLRDQLSHQSNSSNLLIPPPPPRPPTPPPLPPPRRTIIAPLTVSSIRKRSGPHMRQTTDAFLQSARAALRRLDPPVEAPINSVTAPHVPMRRKSIARPTVNVPSEKMADFLNEVRSAKLKKISGTLAPPLVREEPASSALARTVSHTAKGRDILREMVRRKSMPHIDANAGDKRKRDAIDGDEFAVPPLPIKRVATQGSSASDTSSSSMVSTSSNPFTYNRSFTLADLHNRSWPSITTTDTDLTTPSLCSDNENDHASETGHDTLPPTPPRPHRSPSPSRAGTEEQEQDDPLPEIIEEIDVDAGPESFGEPSDTPIAGSSAVENAFVRRPATQPLPDQTPKKPRPPGRIRIQRPPTPPPQPQTQTQTYTRSRSPSQMHPQRVVASTDKGPPLSRIPVIDLYAVRARTLTQRPAEDTNPGKQHKAHKQSMSEMQKPDTTPVQMSAHARRRLMLDEELRRAGDHLWSSDAPDEEEELENGILVGVGIKNNHNGFLARGGGGGSPVFMGVGYVQGAEDVNTEY